MEPYIIPVARLVLSSQVGAWCKIPYPGHPKGCPNYGTEDRCPPHAPHVSEYFDTSRQLYIVHSEFDLSGHQERMQEAHPQWSDRQCRCVLYWQPRSRKQLKERAAQAMKSLGLDAMAWVPEAMGVNVYATCKLSGLHLEQIRNLKTCRHVALIGHGQNKTKGQLKLF